MNEFILIVSALATFVSASMFSVRLRTVRLSRWSLAGWLVAGVIAQWMALAWLSQTSFASLGVLAVGAAVLLSGIIGLAYGMLISNSLAPDASDIRPRHLRPVRRPAMINRPGARVLSQRREAHAGMRRIFSRGVRATTAMLLALIAAQPANAQAQAEAASDATDTSFLDRVTVSVGIDFASAYYFRGIPQENQGFIGQPYASIAYKAFNGEEGGWIKDITFSVGAWNSLHSGPTGSDGTHDSPEIWYEADIIASVSATVFDEFTASAIYTAYTSPNDSYNTYQEIAFKLAWNDSARLGKWALNPYALIAFEIDDQADGGNSAFGPVASTNEGIYLELGIAPSLPLIESESTPVSLVFPVAAGFSLDDYYEDGAGDGTGSGFGFVDVGVELSLPLAAIMPSDSGAWSLRTGPHFLWLSDDAADLGGAINGGDDFEVWWKLSLGWTF